jgi:anti-anti-sigma factor
MEIRHHYKNKTLVVDVNGNDGKLIKDDLELFIKEILKLHTKESKEIAVNLSNKTYLNSSGLGDLIKVKDSLMDNGVGLVLINPTARVVSLLEMVGVDQFFHIVSKEDDLG